MEPAKLADAGVSVAVIASRSRSMRKRMLRRLVNAIKAMPAIPMAIVGRATAAWASAPTAAVTITAL
jgi:hypothetical protein